MILKLPSRLALKFSGQKVLAAIDKAEKANAPRISAKTQIHYLHSLKGFFEWAVREDLRPDNPAQRIHIKAKKAESRRLPFGTQELKKIFNAPLYTGCVDDEMGYGKPGPRKPRRHRFWIPLLGLYTGMRLNEICQLQVADICKWEDGVYFDLRRYPVSGRKLKNTSSERRVPIHPKIVELGFLD